MDNNNVSTSSSSSAGNSHMCQPLRTLNELLTFHRNPVNWNSLVRPLATRSSARKPTKDYLNFFYPTETENDPNHREVLVCHDFRGNYREDSYINGSEKWDGYRFYNWYAIDIFCYFSHELVTIPTLQWINAAHKHGVIVLGTFIVEFKKGQEILEQILASREQMLCVADALVLISKYCGFEGWLLNIECGLSKEKVPLLIEFVERLTTLTHEQIPSGRILWYDSITVDGLLLWQNELNDKNSVFFEKCDGIFLNYTWGDAQMSNTLTEVRRINPSRAKDIFVGIDIFGRNQVAKFETYKTLERIPSHLSVALFATGWTLESVEIELKQERKSHAHDEINVRFMNRDVQFWQSLWNQLRMSGPSKLPFYSSFCLGSGYFANRLGMRVNRRPWHNLSKQEYQISVPSVQRNFDEALDGGSCLVFNNIDSMSRAQRLLVCSFQRMAGLILSLAFKRSHPEIDVNLLLMAYSHELGVAKCIILPSSRNAITTRESITCLPIPVDSFKDVQDFLQRNGKKHLPAVDAINGWELRHFHIQFDPNLRVEITDIGHQFTNLHPYEENLVKIGAISIHDSIGSTVPVESKVIGFHEMQLDRK